MAVMLTSCDDTGDRLVDDDSEAGGMTLEPAPSKSDRSNAGMSSKSNSSSLFASCMVFDCHVVNLARAIINAFNALISLLLPLKSTTEGDGFYFRQIATGYRDEDWAEVVEFIWYLDDVSDCYLAMI